MALSRLPQTLTNWVVSADLSATAFLLILVVAYLILGMFLDSLAVILLTVPLLVAPLTALGVDLVWFGVFVIVMVEIAMVTPPIGVLSFIIHRISQDKNVNLGTPISLGTVFKGVMPFVAVALGFVLLLIMFPDIAMWLPNQMGK
jgi:TRAP-type C4-dicarboxylate transport system permease large subunit